MRDIRCKYLSIKYFHKNIRYKNEAFVVGVSYVHTGSFLDLSRDENTTTIKIQGSHLMVEVLPVPVSCVLPRRIPHFEWTRAASLCAANEEVEGLFDRLID